MDEGHDVRDRQAHPRHVLSRVSALDLSAYAARIGVPVPDTIDLPALQRLQQAHVGAIPFENLDVQWRRTVRIDPASVWAKLVGSARGGASGGGRVRSRTVALGDESESRSPASTVGASIAARELGWLGVIGASSTVASGEV